MMCDVCVACVCVCVAVLRAWFNECVLYEKILFY